MAVLPEVATLIAHFGLTPLPVELTLFASTYRSAQLAAPGQSIGSAMVGLYCDEPPSRSLFHRLSGDELWHFYSGDPLRLVLLYPDGSSRDVIMGPDPLAGQHVQFAVPAGVWQAGHMLPGGRYSLYGCSLAPGYVDSMFEPGTRQKLLPGYPGRAADIEMLACPD